MEDIPQTQAVQTNPCFPSPCGQYASCNSIGNLPSCACMPHCLGTPPNCRPECTVSSDCPAHLACNNERCRDPCAGSCGLTAYCSVHNHVPVCTCPEGFVGDPFNGCTPRPPSKIDRSLNLPLFFFCLFVRINQFKIHKKNTLNNR